MLSLFTPVSRAYSYNIFKFLKDKFMINFTTHGIVLEERVLAAALEALRNGEYQRFTYLLDSTEIDVNTTVPLIQGQEEEVGTLLSHALRICSGENLGFVANYLLGKGTLPTLSDLRNLRVIGTNYSNLRFLATPEYLGPHLKRFDDHTDFFQRHEIRSSDSQRFLELVNKYDLRFYGNEELVPIMSRINQSEKATELASRRGARTQLIKSALVE